MAKVEEHVFDCPVPSCGGKLRINADLCRFGHGVTSTCAPDAGDTGQASAQREAHKCKWCHVSYIFTLAELWGEHLSYCTGAGVPTNALCHHTASLQPGAAGHRADSALAMPGDAADCGATSRDKGAGKGNRASAGDKCAQSKKLGKGAPTSGFNDVGILKAQLAEGFDETTIELVARELKKHRKTILCGEEESTKWWSDRLRELQRETVIRYHLLPLTLHPHPHSHAPCSLPPPSLLFDCSRLGSSTSHSALQAHATFPKPVATHDGDNADTNANLRDSTLFYAVAAGDVAAITKCLQLRHCEELDVDDGVSNSPLHWAAATGCAATCRALVFCM